MTAKQAVGVILAGGESRRFGSDKANAFLMGRPLLQWVAEAVAGACSRIVVLAAGEQELPGVSVDCGVQTVRDSAAFKGPLNALAGLPDLGAEWGFVVSCDAPLLQGVLVTLLATHADNRAAVIPRVQGRLQPLPGLYRAEAIAQLRSGAQSGESRLTAAVEALNPLVLDEDVLREADPRLVSFLNINTRADLERAEELFRSGLT